ncbi:MAG: sulfatase-like hydrolase/transferase, partial [Maribacter sp.]|nr:sulfatase-like hydrolase/transferase [Maribacter sp.]
MFKKSQLFPLTIGILIFTLASCGESKEKEVQKTSQRPNILFIMSDDHAYQAISAYSDKLIQTPNIDRIAKEGILFSNA